VRVTAVKLQNQSFANLTHPSLSSAQHSPAFASPDHRPGNV
jgi:hypothetical protein